MLLVIISCTSNDKVKYKNVDTELIPYVEKFNENYTKYCNKEVPTNIYVKFDKIEGSRKALGVYNRITNRTYINIDKWQNLYTEQKEMVLLHELGHHVLKRNHIFHLNKEECSDSIMYYQLFPIWCYNRYKQILIEELFKGEDSDC